MDKLAKLTSLLKEEQDIDWLFSHKTKEVAGYQAYMRALWDDNASRFLWKRFALPFEDDTSKILPEKTHTIEKSQDVIDGSAALFENCIKVQTFSEEISELLKEAEKEQANSAHSFADGQKYYENVERERPAVDHGMKVWEKDEQTFNSIYSKRKSVYGNIIDSM